MLTKSLIKSTFSERTLERGSTLYRTKRVLTIAEEDDIIRGSVRSASDWDATYLASIRISDDKLTTLCTCPVRVDCKHAAALCHHVLANRQHWADEDSDIEAWLSNIYTPSAPLSSQQKNLLYLLEPDNYSGQNKIDVNLRTSSRKKSGGWSRTLGSEYATADLLKKAYLDQSDVQIISHLIKEGKYSYQQECFHAETLMQMVATGRTFWQPALDLDHPLKAGPTLQGQWQWQPVDKGLTRLQLTITDNPDDGKELQIFHTSPVSYYDKEQGQFGLIETNIDANLAPHLLASPVFSDDQMPWVMSKLNMRLGKQSQSIEKPKLNTNIELTQPIPHLLLSSPDQLNPSAGEVTLFFNYDGKLINPRETSPFIKVAGKAHKLYRDVGYEEQVVERLLQAHFQLKADNRHMYWSNEPSDYRLRLQKKQHWYQFLHHDVPLLEQQGWHIAHDDDFHYQELITDGKLEAEIQDSDSHDFFSIGLNLDIDGERVPAFPVLQSAIEQLPRSLLTKTNNDDDVPADSDKVEDDDDMTLFVELDKGKFIALKYSSIKPLLRQFVELFMPGAVDKQGNLKLSRYQGHQTLSVLDDQGIATRGAETIRRLAERLKNFTGIEDVPPAANLKADLRAYQRQGVNWMQFLREYQLAGILADDMGLGKTVQTLAHLSIEKEQGRMTAPCLIAAPTSVIFNWANEIEKFTPFLKYCVVHGPNRGKQLKSMHECDLIITSYALVSKDLEFYQGMDLYYLILDEAQYIKNPKTKLYEALLQFNSKHRLCLTGTPMENHLGEFWSQFNFLLPGFLGSHRQFTKLFRTPIQSHADYERKVLLNQRIKPFILRRTKENIATELPAKTEILQTVRVEGKQAELYESVRLTMDSRLNDIIKAKGIGRSQIEILDALLKLRQVCCHPQLLPLEAARSVHQSAKLELLMDMLPELIDEGRKILLFSQFTSMLEIIEQQLDKQNIEYLKLTGASTNRQQIVDRFQAGEVPVFLISLRAGGVGLNLTAADTVIHYDPWWNPAVENQATDRAHRIGQDKPVFVYKLIVENSIEEKIQQIQQEKADLARALLSEEVGEGKLSLTDDVLQSLLSPLE